ncbi:CPBP family intramembrane glutamic endopeptidase [Pedobacter metabolipauper]|uniref:Membrane protease YdiL (CAAX protease family) n=1 Tax=Pedobacter metabolipauper TaxID=425513 RepID=A0A4R6SR02_9SPHI|nr:CPBP family intramembrane glutamic endopeptidase [Pedobacter metabolipauper]TDQ06852.1 membrane protease YdiL (CAAX protease family) [Pedobacter metabolipauper]
MDQQITQPIICSNCENPISAGIKFCSSCGQAQNEEELKTYNGKWPNLKQIALFFSIQLLLCVSPSFFESTTITSSLFFDIISAVAAISFFGYSWQENKHLLKWPNFSLKKLLLLIGLAIGSSLLINFLVGYINQTLFKADFSYYGPFMFHEYGSYLMILSIAIFPALFEELACRGYLLQKLLKIVDKREAIYITSILFFLMHFSLISFFWMIPFAMVMAYVRIKENTLWYGIAMHFFFNLTVCLIDILNPNNFF